MPVKNIIFDLGNVLINIDFQQLDYAFKKLGIMDFDQFRAKHELVLNQLETNAVTPEQFRHYLKTVGEVIGTDDEIDQAWNAIFRVDELGKDHFLSCLVHIKQLRERGYRVYLYSNTNAIHLDYMRRIYKEWGVPHSQHDPAAPLMHYFDREYYSHLLGYRKPHIEGFVKIIEENRLVGSETLFVDDLYENILGAKEAGLQGLHINVAEQMTILKHLHPHLARIDQELSGIK